MDWVQRMGARFRYADVKATELELIARLRIYIYIKRERKRERERKGGKELARG